MDALEATHRTDQERFVRAFFRDNVRVAGDLSFGETTVEAVAFAVTVAWTLDLDTSDVERTGAYEGDASTIFVAAPEQLARETQSHAARLFGDPETYATARAAIERLPERGLTHAGPLRIRTEVVKIAHVYPCAPCKGDGKTTCRPCSGSGRVDCTSCSGSGTTSCTICSGSGRVSTSSSGSESTYRSCSCQGGRVRCGRCSGNRKLRCSPCSGEGRVACATCKGTGRRSTVRELTLVAGSARAYVFKETTSAAARDALSRDEPGALARSVYTGAWETEPSQDLAGRTLTYAMRATTRFLETRVRTNGEEFDFRTYGETLRVAGGGGLVEHILRADTQSLESALGEPLLANPVAWVAGVTSACDVVLASRIHALAFARHAGSSDGHDVLGSLSSGYAESTAETLTTAFRRLLSLLSDVPWFACLAIVTLVLAFRIPSAAAAIEAGGAVRAIAAVPFGLAVAVAAATALVFFASQAFPILAFSHAGGEPSLRALAIARRGSLAKAIVFATVFALALAAIVVF